VTQEELNRFNAGLIETDAYKKHKQEIEQLKKNDVAVMGKLGVLEKGQEEIEEEMREGFAKGKATMGEHSRQISALDVKVENMTKETKELITNSIQLVLKKIDEKEMSELKDEIRTLKKKEEKDEAKDEARKWDLIKIVTSAIIGVVITFLGIRILGGQ